MSVYTTYDINSMKTKMESYLFKQLKCKEKKNPRELFLFSGYFALKTYFIFFLLLVK